MSRCLSLTQPWASLVAHGLKKVETRSWATSYRGDLLIHASRGFPVECRELCAFESFKSALRAAGILSWHDLPRGVILATVTLRACLTTTELTRGRWADAHGSLLSEQELAFGDYTPGRYAWLLDDVRRLPEPIPAKGSLGLWEWQP